jgi:RNA polymerase sigma-70 factor (ECF subfamily)
LDPLSDNALMLKVKSGDIARLGLLFERHHKSLFGFLVRISGDPGLSEDLVQNVFEKILKNRKQFKGFGKFTTWMFSIAHNEWIDHAKKRQRRPDRTPFEDSMNNHQTDNNLVEPDEKQEQVKMLEQAFARLDDEPRQLLALTKYEGLSYREAGEILSISEGNARIKAYRAMQELRSHFLKIEKQLTS